MVFEAEGYPFPLRIGAYGNASTREEFTEFVQESLESPADFVISPLFKEQDILPGQRLSLDACFISSDLVFGRETNQRICPLLNRDIVADPREEDSHLQFIIGYFGYLGVKCAVIEFAAFDGKELANKLNRLESTLFTAGLGLILQIQLGSEEESEPVWLNYLTFREHIDQRISITLMVQMVDQFSELSLNRWIAQKIGMLIVPQQVFVLNKKGHRVLPLPLEVTLSRLLSLGCNLVLKSIVCTSIHEQLKYGCYLYENMASKVSKAERKARMLGDYLQHPLQPYSDNLPSETYQVFEDDVPKYDQYEIALLDALGQWQDPRPVVIHYAGSGRGGILPNLMAASKKTKKKVEVYAIQKNPYALQALKRIVHTRHWQHFVTIVEADLKHYKPTKAPDILLSELLGAFGDNELAPEVLQWAEKYITPNTICIPKRYSSFVKPISYPAIARTLKGKQLQCYESVYPRCYHSCFESQHAWSYEHPLKEGDTLERSAKLLFKASQKILVTGILGTFDTQLYGKGYLSIVPESPTMGSYSWFPLYFSMRETELMDKGETLALQIRRMCNSSSVWYEWMYELSDQEGHLRKSSDVHNEKGNVVSINL